MKIDAQKFREDLMKYVDDQIDELEKHNGELTPDIIHHKFSHVSNMACLLAGYHKQR